MARLVILASTRHPIRRPYAGGLEALTHRLAVELRHRGHDVRLATADGGHDLDPSLSHAASPGQRVRPEGCPLRWHPVDPSAGGHQLWYRPPSGVRTPH
jgi:hypothetical protein